MNRECERLWKAIRDWRRSPRDYRLRVNFATTEHVVSEEQQQEQKKEEEEDKEEKEEVEVELPRRPDVNRSQSKCQAALK